ncbi:MAG TPA: DUF6582 domain-containing protein [Stellaceae bacterium]|jgi:phage head maturation protease|nr:DUF6582 domain-containing protein [Stellaceae bacterium]
MTDTIAKRFFVPLAKVDAEGRMVYGYASTEAEDDQGETITLDALRAALDDYMQFANIREMHQLSAVGTAEEAAVDDKGLYIGARIVDPRAWEKVTSGVYKGYSIGGKVTARDPTNRAVITGLSLSEISLVDRPANPEAVFDCWKRSKEAMTDTDLVIPADEVGIVRAFLTKLGIPGLAKAGDGDKPYGEVEYADPGHQEDGKKRYPVDTVEHIRAAWNYIHKPKNAKKYSADHLKEIKAKIVAAWKEKIDKDGPPEASDESGKTATASSVAKGMEDIGRFARMIEDMFWAWEKLEIERAMEGDDSTLPDDLKSLIAQMVAFQQQHAGEETEEFLDGTETPVLPLSPYGSPIPIYWAAHAESLRKAGKTELAERIEKLAADQAEPKGVTMTDDEIAKRSEDQHLKDVAHAAIHKALGMDTMDERERGHGVQAREAMKAAGAGEDGTADEHSTVDTAGNPTHPAPSTGGGDPTGKAALLDAHLDAIVKQGGGHRHLMDIAHECVRKLTDGATCKSDAAKAARHSKDVLDNLHKAHFQVCAAGAKCDAAGGLPDEHQGTTDDKKDAEVIADLAKAVSAEISTGVGAALAELRSEMGAIAKDVAAIKATPIPAQTINPAGVTRFTKASDAGAVVVPTDVVDALAKLSDEERTLAMIKAVHRNPITAPRQPTDATT